MDRKSFVDWALIMGGFGLFAAVGGWAGGRQCSLVGSLGGCGVLWAGVVALIPGCFVLDRWHNHLSRGRGAFMATGIVSLFAALAACFVAAASLASDLGCAW